MAPEFGLARLCAGGTLARVGMLESLESWFDTLNRIYSRKSGHLGSHWRVAPTSRHQRVQRCTISQSSAEMAQRNRFKMDMGGLTRTDGYSCASMSAPRAASRPFRRRTADGPARPDSRTRLFPAQTRTSHRTMITWKRYRSKSDVSIFHDLGSVIGRNLPTNHKAKIFYVSKMFGSPAFSPRFTKITFRMSGTFKGLECRSKANFGMCFGCFSVVISVISCRVMSTSKEKRGAIVSELAAVLLPAGRPSARELPI